MGINIFEVKTVLRSILISSSVVINVTELNRDFKEQEGIGIPYKELGYDSLLGFLKSIPDVLLVDGDSCYSGVILVESEKSAHVSDLVLKQKHSKKPGAFHSNKISGTRRGAHKKIFKKNPSNKEFCNENRSGTVNAALDRHSSQEPICDKSNKSRSSNTSGKTSVQHHHQSQVTNIIPENAIIPQKNSFSINEKTSQQNNHQSEMVNTIPEKNSFSIDLGKTRQRLSNENKNLGNSPSNEIRECSETVIESTKLLRRINYKNDSLSVDNSPNKEDSLKEDSCSNVDVSLKASGKEKNTNYWRGGTTGILKRMKNTDSSEEGTFKNFEKLIESSSSMASDVTRNNIYDIKHSRTMKNSKQKNKQEKCNFKNVSSGIEKSRINTRKQDKSQNSIPNKVQQDLQKLISNFPEGLWCSELPTVYKNLFEQDLHFEEFGYRCLSHLCFDLGNIFFCVKESSCDYRLYDARKPLPTTKMAPEHNNLNTSDSSSIDSLSGIPEIHWEGSDSFLPEDAVKLGFKIERIQVADLFKAGININVVVAEIYDISKFWIYLDDFKLEKLMNDMQVFYGINKRYLIPKSLLAEGLHCVVVYQAKFHRVVILNVMPDEDYIKVYYFDYGTLGTVSKSEVWFMNLEFSELPSQAIRARLAEIYPPYEGVTWSPFANYDFSKFTCMKKLTAEIVRIDKQKNLVDIRLKNSHGLYMSDLLVDLKHALFINKTPKKRIEDPNCKSRVKFIHLFPTFEEIENWVVPSMEEAADFLNTPVTADFLFSQYFSRNVDKDLINSIEEKMKTSTKKKKVLTKHIKSEDLLLAHDIEEMNKILYGALYDPRIIKTEAGHDIEEKRVEEISSEVDSKNNSWVAIEDDETLARVLRQTRMKKLYSFDGEEFQEDVNNSEDKVNIEDARSNSNVSPMKKFCDKVSRELSNFSELEKYLSEESSSKDASKKSSPNLIDLDNEYVSSFNASTNLLLCSEFEQSLLELARSRKKCHNCLLTESIPGDTENCLLVNPLDLPIPKNTNNNITSFDLIQFDVGKSMPYETSDSDPQEAINSIETNSKFKAGSEEVSDADDEDSDSKQHSVKFPYESCQLKAYQKKSLDKSSDTNTAIEEIHEMVNICKISNGSREKELICDTLNIQQSTDQSNKTNLEIFKSITHKLNNESYSGELFLSDMNLGNRNCDIGIDLASFAMNQSITEKKLLSNASNKTSFSSNSIATIDSVEFNNIENLEESTTSMKMAATDQKDEKYFTTENEVESPEIIEKLKLQSIVEKDLNLSNNYMTNTEKHLYTTLDFCKESVHSAEPSELDKFKHLEAVGTSSDLKTCPDNMIDLKDDGNMNLHESSSSTNLYYSCDSKQSSIPDSSCEDSFDFTNFSINDDSVDASTPFPGQSDLKKDSSFLEEFDIIDGSPTLSPISDERNVASTSNLSVISGEWMSLEIPTSQMEMDDGIPKVSQSTGSEALVKQNDSDMDISSSSSSKVIEESQVNSTKDNEEQTMCDSLNTSNIVNDGISVSPNNTNVQAPVPSGPQSLYSPNNLMPQPRIITRGPPPGFPPSPPPGFPPIAPHGFHPVPTCGYTTVLVPNCIRYPNGFVAPMQRFPGQQLEIVNEVAQYYRTQPIVVLNYSFLPPMNQDENR